jgi:endo-1,4-beta-mannosidase
LEWLEEESNKYSVLDSCIELPRNKVFGIQKKEEKEILIEFNNMVNKISRIEGINPTLFFSKQNQKILLLNTLSLGLEGALLGITKWRSMLIKKHFSALMKSYGIS